MQRVLVTGCNGFVGSHVCERLVKKGHRVIGVDTASYKWNDGFLQLVGHRDYKYIEGDITDGRFVSSVVENSRPQKVVHLASVVGINHYIENPLKVIDVNILGLRNLLEALKGSGAGIVFSSTSEIYGKNPLVPWKEDADRVLGATRVSRWAYSTSKAAAEHMLWACAAPFNIQPAVVRYFNLYGPRQRPDLLVPAQISRALKGQDLMVYDGGDQTRCFTYIEDAVSATLEAAFNPSALGHAFNIGSDVETSVGDITRLIGSLSRVPYNIKEVLTQKIYGSVYEDIPRRVPDVDKAARVLGWRAATPLSEGLTKTIEWWRGQISGNMEREFGGS